MEQLTEIQSKVFEFVKDALANGGAPSIREIAKKFRYKSERAAQFHIQAIIRKGWLTSETGKARSLRLAELPQRARIADIPLFGSIPAGFSSERKQESEGCVSVDIETLAFKPTRHTFALRVKGDSMIGKHICEDDIVILEHGAEPRPGQVVAALIDGKNTLKTFFLRGNKPFLRAENPKYPDLFPADELVIQGVVKVLIRRSKG